MPTKLYTCAYCGRTGTKKEGNREHFVPRNLWGGRRPNKTLTVWVHKACNASYSEDDEYFRTVLIAKAGSQEHPEARKVLEGPLIRVMEKLPTVFMKHINKVSEVEVRSPSGLFLGTSLGFALDVPRFIRVLKKIVMGLYFSKLEKSVPSDTFVSLAWATQFSFEVMAPILPFMSPLEDFGDDVFTYCWYCLPSDGRRTFWALSFYERFTFFAFTAPSSVKIGEVESYEGVSRGKAWVRA